MEGKEKESSTCCLKKTSARFSNPELNLKSVYGLCEIYIVCDMKNAFDVTI